MKTSAIRIEGNIISDDFFDKIDLPETLGQSGKDFGFEKNQKIRDEIARCWADAKDQYNIYKRRIEQLNDKDKGTEETRKYWINPLLENLGYKLEYNSAGYIVNGKNFTISHKCKVNIDFPVHVVSFKKSLDKRGEDKTMSPHAMVQEYLNLTEHLYAIVSNGSTLRILRDSGKIVRLSFLEFDLVKIMEENLYGEFAIFYRLVHASRMPKRKEEADSCLFEQYHQNAIESGSRIREGLSTAFINSIDILAKGFLEHPKNELLRNSIYSNYPNVGNLNGNDEVFEKLSSEKYFLYLLRLLYRILFLFVIEERDLVFAEIIDPDENTNEKVKRLKSIYYNYYSLTRLRRLSEKLYFYNNKLEDIWISLKHTFRIFEDEKYSSILSIYPLGGDLFSYDSIGVLNESYLDNETLLKCIKHLTIFENVKKKETIKVSYASLNVEEFGSVYEGILEFTGKFTFNGKIKFSLDKSSARASSGSHYTPEELVQPLIKNSLEHIIENIKADVTKDVEKEYAKQYQTYSSIGIITAEKSIKKKEKIINALLNLKICDVSCGSGHILLTTARRLAIEVAKTETGEDQPVPTYYRKALRNVIRHCIYGVDINPLAVELCKVSLWLESHNPGEPLSFLDHKIKCGNSIVGLARIEELNENINPKAFDKLPGDDPKTCSMLRKENDLQLKGGVTLFDKTNLDTSTVTFYREMFNFDNLPENTLEEVKVKKQKYETLKGSDYYFYKQLSDLQTAQFFIPKTEENKRKITTTEDYINFSKKDKSVSNLKISASDSIAAEKRFYNWFIEFPEVFLTEQNGFDLIIGNPPFLGGQRLSGTYGDNFLNYVKYKYKPAGSCDLVTYFFRRVFDLIKPKGFMALISTNTIAQGVAREGGLEIIIKNGGNINFAVRSTKWPGVAAVDVALITIFKGEWLNKRLLGKVTTKYISAYLDEEESLGEPYTLSRNKGKSFQGSIVLGLGFVLTPEKAEELIKRNPKNKDVIFPYLNGDDLNSHPEQKPSRYVINFFDWEEEYCKNNYPDCYEIILEKVKPERTRVDSEGNFVLRKPLPQKWWIYGEKRPALYSAIKDKEKVLVITLNTKYVCFNYVNSHFVYSHSLGILSPEENYFLIISSAFHEYWSWKNSSTMGNSVLRYTPTSCFETFPFPIITDAKLKERLKKIGEEYHTFRSNIMVNLQIGLTATYNLFHNPKFNYENKNNLKLFKDIKEENLRISIDQAINDIHHLRKLHTEMDNAVLEAYGWTDIRLNHNFYEVDFLPDNDNIRFTISPESRKDILKRLLLLNHKIHEEEMKEEAQKPQKPKKTKKVEGMDELF